AEQLDEAVQRDIRLGLLSSTVARELVRLPRGNQMPVSVVVRQQGLSSRQAAQLVTLLLKTDDPEAQGQILADPLAYLQKQSQERPVLTDPRLSALGNAMRSSLLAMSGVCDRASRTCGKVAPGRMAPPDAEILAPLIEIALRAGKTALTTLSQLSVSCGQEQAHG
ncbi:MAG: hypothetical protein JW797_03590, partial [Bradymonadales bacterium]|nr:hypothetical protein [Bradymonadales bacterium]